MTFRYDSWLLQHKCFMLSNSESNLLFDTREKQAETWAGKPWETRRLFPYLSPWLSIELEIQGSAILVSFPMCAKCLKSQGFAKDWHVSRFERAALG